jgi:hypothetical protein
MLRRIICIGLAAILMACSITESSKSNSSSAVKEQRLSTDFTDEGIKITYTFTTLNSHTIFY